MSNPASLADAPAAAAPHPLRHPPYRRWLIGNTVSLLGDQCYLVALPWLILQLTNSAAALGTVMMTAAVPRAILMLIGGAVSDRISARKVMLATALMRTACVGLLTVLVWQNTLHMWELYAIVLMFGIADAFALPAQSAYMPSLVAREQLVAASSASGVVAQAVTILGPAPAGLLIDALGLATAFFVDALSFLAVIAALWRLPDPPPAAAAPKGMRSAIAEGINYVIKDVPLRSLMIMVMAMNFCLSGPIAVGLAYLAKNAFNSPAAYGTMISAFAAGGLFGALLAGVWKTQRRGWLMLATSALIAICLTLVGQLHALWSVASLFLVMGSAAGLSNVHIGAWIMQRIEVAMRGRVTSVLMLGSLGIAPISLAIAGFAVAWGISPMFICAGLLMLLATGLAALHDEVRGIR